MLEIKNIYKTFNKGTVNEKKALNGVSFTLNDGDFVTVIGGNGAGKSTTLNAVAGVWPVDSGSIIIDGINVPHDEQDEQKRQQRCHEQHPQKQHLGPKAVEHRVGAAQTFEHRKTSLCRSGTILPYFQGKR